MGRNSRGLYGLSWGMENESESPSRLWFLVRSSYLWAPLSYLAHFFPFLWLMFGLLLNVGLEIQKPVCQLSVGKKVRRYLPAERLQGSGPGFTQWPFCVTMGLIRVAPVTTGVWGRQPRNNPDWEDFCLFSRAPNNCMAKSMMPSPFPLLYERTGERDVNKTIKTYCHFTRSKLI